VSSLTDLAVTKLDVLDTLDRIALCTGYRVHGEHVNEFPSDIAALDDVEPEYEWFDGWQSSTGTARKLEDLPGAARRYLDRVQALAEAPIRFVSVGTRRDRLIGN
jgi:adenylosuccinate synthase